MKARSLEGARPRTAALVTLALAAGCSSAGPAPVRTGSARPPSVEVTGAGVDMYIAPERAVVSKVVEAPPDAVWAAVPKAWADLGLAVRERSDAERTLGNSRLVVSRRLGDTPLSTYLECGSGLTGAFADRYRIEMLIRTSVVPTPGGDSSVETYIEASARNPEGSSNTRVACSSSQRLEQAIADRVRFYALLR